MKDIEEIAKIKMPDLKCTDIEQAKKLLQVVQEVWVSR